MCSLDYYRRKGEKNVVKNAGDAVPSLARNTRWVSGYIGIFMAVRLVRGAVIPKILDPGAYGLWSSLTVVNRYLPYADLGVLAQYAKRFPRLMGEKRTCEARSLEARTLGFLGIVSVPVFLGLALAGLGAREDPEFYRPAMLLLGVSFLLSRFRQAAVTALGSRERFALSSSIDSLFLVINLIASIALALRWGALGLVAGAIAGELAALAVLAPRLRLAAPRWPDRAFLRSIREGFLLLRLQLSELFLYSMDQVFLIFLASPRELGLYSLGLFAVGVLLAPAGIFQTVLHPRVMRLTGAGAVADARELIERAVGFYALMATAASLLALPAIDLLLGHYFHDYVAGRTAAFILVSLAVVRGPLLILRIHYLSINRERFLVRVQTAFGVSGALLDALALTAGYGIEGVAAATAAVYLAFAAVVWIDFERGSSPVRAGKYIAMSGGLGLLAITVARLAAREPRLDLWPDLLDVAGRGAFAVGLLALAGWLARGWIAAQARPFVADSAPAS